MKFRYARTQKPTAVKASFRMARARFVNDSINACAFFTNCEPLNEYPSFL
jgi:hypothetical protein